MTNVIQVVQWSVCVLGLVAMAGGQQCGWNGMERVMGVSLCWVGGRGKQGGCRCCLGGVGSEYVENGNIWQQQPAATSAPALGRFQGRTQRKSSAPLSPPPRQKQSEVM